MKSLIPKVISLTQFCLALTAAGSSMLFAQTATTSQTTYANIIAAKTADQFASAYFQAPDNESKISVLQALPYAIKKFKTASNDGAVPAWLTGVLSDALGSNEPRVALAAVDQIGINGLRSHSSRLITMYHQKSGAVQLRAGILQTLGGLGTPEAIDLIGTVIDSHVLSAETNMALMAAGKSCTADLIPKINSYIADIKTRIQNGEFKSDASDKTGAVTGKKPLVSPEMSVNIASGVIQMILSQQCCK